MYVYLDIPEGPQKTKAPTTAATVTPAAINIFSLSIFYIGCTYVCVCVWVQVYVGWAAAGGRCLLLLLLLGFCCSTQTWRDYNIEQQQTLICSPLL